MADHDALSSATAELSPRAPFRLPNSRRVAPYLFISPFFILYAAFLVGPILFALWLSLHQWSGLGSPTWVGLQNYSDLLQDRSLREATLNTLIYVAASVFIICPAAFFLALGINARGLAFRDLFRVGFFLPVVISPIVVSVIFTIIFDRDAGLMNAVLRGVLGLAPVNWLGMPGWAKVSIILVLFWRWTGYLTIYFLAGLQNIPKELYEAASMDGAGTWSKFVHVTLPSIKPVTAFVTVIVVIGAAQVFEEPYLLTRGGPGEATLSLTQFIYRTAFERQELGYACAAGMTMFVAVFVVARLIARALGVARDD